MTATLGWSSLFAIVLLTSAGAQEPATYCPMGTGVLVATSGSGDSSVAAPLAAASARGSIDTVWRFAIGERLWTWSQFVAVVGAGVETDMSRGTSTAAGSAPRRAATACVGAHIMMGRTTLVLRGAQGAVRLRADLRRLSSEQRSARDSSNHRR